MRKERWKHEFITKGNIRVAFLHFFGMPKILSSHTKLLPKPRNLEKRPYDCWRWPHECADAFTIRAEFEKNQIRVSIFCQIRDSVTLA